MIPAHRRVDVLYTDPLGVYPSLVGRARCWDEARDAKLYRGPGPVVAHPPCGPWGRLNFLCKYQDPGCGPAAVTAVRTVGGVLEHPANSKLWPACGMPKPGEPCDAWGGFTLAVSQVSWGHRAVKPTWIYCVGVSPELAAMSIRTGGVATARTTNGPRGAQLPRFSNKTARSTPPAFARWLIFLALSTHWPRVQKIK